MIKPVVGERFGEWIVISELVIKYEKWYKFNVRCNCGYEGYVMSSALRNGKVARCRKCANEKLYKGYKDISSSYFSEIIRGAKNRNLEFSVTKEYIWELLVMQNFKCAISGLDILHSKSIAADRKNKNIISTASLDRIDSSKGYIEGNLQWLHRDINIMKLDHSEEYFVKLCRLVTENCK